MCDAACTVDQRNDAHAHDDRQAGGQFSDIHIQGSFVILVRWVHRRVLVNRDETVPGDQVGGNEWIVNKSVIVM